MQFDLRRLQTTSADLAVDTFYCKAYVSGNKTSAMLDLSGDPVLCHAADSSTNPVPSTASILSHPIL
eukprot:11772611-Karenia_brevis.AAC.1